MAVSITLAFRALALPSYLLSTSSRLSVGCRAAIEIPTMLWTERVLLRVGGAFTLALSCLLFGGSFLGLAVIPNPELLLFAALLEGISYGLFITATVRLDAGWSPHGQVATYQGMVNAGGAGRAPLLAGLLGGAIFDTSGPQAVFVASAVAVAVAMLVLLVAQTLGLFSGDLAPEG